MPARDCYKNFVFPGARPAAKLWRHRPYAAGAADACCWLVTHPFPPCGVLLSQDTMGTNNCGSAIAVTAINVLQGPGQHSPLRVLQEGAESQPSQVGSCRVRSWLGHATQNPFQTEASKCQCQQQQLLGIKDSTLQKWKVVLPQDSA